MDNENVLEIDLQKLVFAYLKKWWLIVLCAVIAGVIAFVYTAHFVTPMYRSSVTIYVNNSRDGEQVDSISSSNLSTSQKLVNTYINMIRSDTVLEKVATASHLDISAEGIREAMSASQIDETELFKVTITHADPQTAADLANAIADVAPAEIANFVEGSSTKIIDYAKVPTYASSPNVEKNCLVGVLAGILIAVIYVTLRVLLDVRIKTDEDLTAMFDIPVLGQVPDFNAVQKKRKGYGQNGYATVAEKKGAAKK